MKITIGSGGVMKIVEEEVKCKMCVSLYGEENAKLATVHVPGIITTMDHYCVFHYLELHPTYRLPNIGDCHETCN